jgi:hypothetical protein
MCCSFVTAVDEADFELKLRHTQECKAENAFQQSTKQRDQLLEELLKINSDGAKFNI